MSHIAQEVVKIRERHATLIGNKISIKPSLFGKIKKVLQMGGLKFVVLFKTGRSDLKIHFYIRMI